MIAQANNPDDEDWTGMWCVDPCNAGEIFADNGIKIVKDFGKESQKKLKVHGIVTSYC